MGKLIKITWFDSKGITSEWEFKDEIKPLKPAEITSVGFLCDDNDKFKTIVQSKCKEQVLGRLSIPCGCIVKIEELNTEA